MGICGLICGNTHGTDPDLSQSQVITDLGQRFTTARYLSQGHCLWNSHGWSGTGGKIMLPEGVSVGDKKESVCDILAVGKQWPNRCSKNGRGWWNSLNFFSQHACLIPVLEKQGHGANYCV